MSKRFYDTDWWKNMVIAIVGTVVGIVLTFGTTFYIEKKIRRKWFEKRSSSPCIIWMQKLII